MPPNTANPREANICQYWSEEELPLCIYWDAVKTLCTYSKQTIIGGVNVIEKGFLYPLCNYVGTAGTKCAHYKSSTGSSTPIPRCILPDPSRHTSISPNCLIKWIIPVPIPPTIPPGDPYEPLDYSDISGYNDGMCNFSVGSATPGGSDIECEGYTPHHMKFGTKPIQEKCLVDDALLENLIVDTPYLPFIYEVMNKRAQLGKCAWWDSNNILFILDGSNEDNIYTVIPPEFKCTNNDPEAQKYADFYNDSANFYIRPPCNGATPDCPKYTGNLISMSNLPFLSNIYLRAGDKILSEQILEIRYNIRKELWSKADYENIFTDDSIIYSYEGTKPEVVLNSTGQLIDYSLVSIKTEITDFACFNISKTQVLLTKGTPSSGNKVDFMSLVRKLGSLPLEPIIRSVFDKRHSGASNDFIFETSYSTHKHILVVGDMFCGEETIAINISEDIAFPFKAMFDAGCMFVYDQTHSTTETQKKLKCYLRALKEVAPSMIYSNIWPQSNRAFAIPVGTVFGENKIVVFDKTSDGDYTFATILITKVFCGGVIAQTSFSAKPDYSETSGDLNLEQTTCHPVNRPELSYEFKPFNGSTGGGTLPYHTYIDTIVNEVSLDHFTHILITNRLYKIRVVPKNTFVSNCTNSGNSSIRMLGNAGYILVTVNDNLTLHAVIKPWDTGQVDASGNPKEMVLYLTGVDSMGNNRSIEMSVIEHCSDRLEINQIILAPKNSSDYVRLYDAIISFPNGLFIYEKFSFGYEPTGDYEEVSVFDDDTVVIRHDSELSGALNCGLYKITNPPIAPIVVSVMFSGLITGRVRGQTKSDLIISVKQPYCSDVEIMYSWSASYNTSRILPDDVCFTNRIGVRYEKTGNIGYSAYCGDHNFGRISTTPAPMWYPYTQCEQYASYELKSATGEKDEAPMDFWLLDGKFSQKASDHGCADLRMLGPAANFGYTVDTRASIWACNCDYLHNNSVMVTPPWFSGWAKVRGGIGGEELYMLTQNGGVPPKFGNKHRPYLFSYRSAAALKFIKITSEGGAVLDKKWLPHYEGFSDLNLDNNFSEYHWKHYFNESDNMSTYLSQLGLLAVTGSIDNIDVSEALVYEGTDLARFRYTDIFRGHYTLTGMLYPEPRRQYSIGELIPKPVTPWLTYKDYTADPTKSIQWAWREKWQDMERSIPNISSVISNLNFDTCDLTAFHMSYLSFIDITYTNYTYNLRLDEFRRVPEEGNHTIHWEPSIYNPTAPLPTHFIVRLDNGPIRIFNAKCVLITDSSMISLDLIFPSVSTQTVIEHTDFYDLCLEDNWLNSTTSNQDLEALSSIIGLAGGHIILYTEGTEVVTTISAAESNAEADDRMVDTVDGYGEQTQLYFNRGIMIDINESMLNHLPKVENLLVNPYSFSLSEPSHDFSNFSTITPDTFYPANTTFGMVYNASIGSSLHLKFEFITPVVISKVVIVYANGEEVIDPDLDINNYYNIPGVIIKKSVDDNTYTNIVTGAMELAEKGSAVTLPNISYITDTMDLNYMSELFSYLSIDFTYEPSVADFNKVSFENLSSYTHFMDIKSIKLYTVEYTSLDESILTYERKFNISIGSYGTYPIHGKESEGSLLYPNPYELSTTYQYDTSFGMVGMHNSVGEFTTAGKVCNRRALAIQEDGEVLNGGYQDFELKQKQLYDGIALSGSAAMQLNSLAEELLASTLKNTQINVFPRWVCKLKNDIMVPLSPVEAKSVYYPKGHHWTWDTSSFKDKFNCGGAVRRWATTFEYKWGRITDTFGYSYETDLFDLYSYGLSETFTNMLNAGNQIANAALEALLIETGQAGSADSDEEMC